MDDVYAFPFPDVRDAQGNGISEGSSGMTLRDWFAGMAMSGFLAGKPMITDEYADATASDIRSSIASIAYDFADDMMAERKKSR